MVDFNSLNNYKKLELIRRPNENLVEVLVDVRAHSLYYNFIIHIIQYILFIFFFVIQFIQYYIYIQTK